MLDQGFLFEGQREGQVPGLARGGGRKTRGSWRGGWGSTSQGHVKECELDPVNDGKHRKIWSRREMIRFMLRKEHPGCGLVNGLKAGGN